MKHKTLFRFIPLLLTLCLLVPMAAMQVLAAEPGESEAVCFEHGDVNGDGKVNLRDAIALLRETAFLKGETSQKFDFNKDKKVDVQDAIYILYNTLGGSFKSTHALKGTVHAYYDPQWNWNGTSVSVTLNCACGKEHKETVTAVKTKDDAVTCVAAGIVEYTATVEVDGQTFTDVKTTTTKPTGHDFNGGNVTCTEGRICRICNYTERALGHNWEPCEEGTIAATCLEDGKQGYKCSVCGEKKQETVVGKAQHTYVSTGEPTQLTDCKWQENFVCSGCGAQKPVDKAKDIYYQHTFTAALTTEPNCTNSGEKTFTCQNCDVVETETISANGVHTWDTGVTNGNITTYTCTTCPATKTAICAEGAANITTSDLSAVSEIQVSDVAVSLDSAALGDLPAEKPAVLSVEEKSAGDINISDDLAKQIGDNTVYDITMTVDNVPVTNFTGTATVSLPYQLGEGEDADCIDIWYIDDSGNVTIMKGTYSNGYVTFTTDHFSHYAITKLKPEEICGKKGHSLRTVEKEATCSNAGCTFQFCTRCDYVGDVKVIEQLPHNYQDVDPRVEATCTTDGTFHEKCTVCGAEQSGTIPALGHNWVEDTAASQAPTCTEAGKKVFTCQNGKETKEEILPVLGHDLETKTVTAKDDDCTGQSYLIETCKRCDYEKRTVTAPAKGHNYTPSWKWSDDHTTATLTLKCDNNAKHTQTLNAVVTKNITDVPSCTAVGKAVYSATAAYNGKTYEETQPVEVPSVGHQTDSTWHTDDQQHYMLCTVCQEKLKANDHKWGMEQIIKEPTCVTPGEASVTCGVCAYTKKVEVPATGVHEYENHVCKHCGAAEKECAHIQLTEKPLDLSSYGVCPDFKATLSTCECGKYGSIYIVSASCNMREAAPIDIKPTPDQEVQVHRMVCSKCGLEVQNFEFFETDPDTCISRQIYTMRLVKGGEVIASGNFINYGWEMAHVTYIPDASGSVTDLKAFGLCGGEIRSYHCTCGRVHNELHTSTGKDCNWVYDRENSTPSQDVLCCAACGAVKTQTVTSVDVGNCTLRKTYDVRIQRKSADIRFTYQEDVKVHDYVFETIRLDGNSCEDGVYTKQVCNDCKKVFEMYSSHHVYVNNTATQLENCCSDIAIQRICACGSYKMVELISENGQECDWMPNGPDSEICTICGTVRTAASTVGPKDNNCYAEVTIQWTYRDKNGKVIFTGVDHDRRPVHNWNTTFELVGQTCLDGVRITETCQDCGTKNSFVETGEHRGKIEEIDLHQYGMCGGKLMQWACACGEERNMWEENEVCQWQYVGGSEDSNVFECDKCKVRKTITYADREAKDPCHEYVTETYTYTRGATTLLTKTSRSIWQNHRSVYTLEIDTGKTCADGYFVTEKCMTCGYTNRWQNQDNGTDHMRWVLKRTELAKPGILCGGLDLVECGCACDKEAEETYTEWYGGECDFQWVSGDENGTVLKCTQCGAVSNSKVLSRKPVDKCQVLVTQQDVIHDKNGNYVCQYEYSYVMHDGSTLETTYTLLGKTCLDGVRVTNRCKVCNWESSFVETGVHRGNREEIDLSQYGMCGGKLMRWACACGEQGSIWEENEVCQWQYVGGSRDSNVFECDKCNVRKTITRTDHEAKDPCHEYFILTYTYTRGETTLLTKTTQSIRETHRSVYTVQIDPGKTCTDGYFVTEHCLTCNYEDTWWNNEHVLWSLKRTELVKPGILCGGLDLVECGCACGRENNNQHAEWYGGSCQMEMDPETGILKCTKCKAVLTSEYLGEEQVDDCHSKWVTSYVYSRDGSTIASYQEEYLTHYNTYTTTSFELDGSTCADGFWAIEYCANCKRTDRMRWENEDCENVAWFIVGREVLYDAKDSCGPIVKETTGCACGTVQETRTRYDSHWFFWVIDEKRYVCSECGLVMEKETISDVQISGNKYRKTEKVTISKDGKTVATCTDVYDYERYN